MALLCSCDLCQAAAIIVGSKASTTSRFEDQNRRLLSGGQTVQKRKRNNGKEGTEDSPWERFVSSLLGGFKKVEKAPYAHVISVYVCV